MAIKRFYIWFLLSFSLFFTQNAQSQKDTQDSIYHRLKGLKKELGINQQSDILISLARYHINQGNLDSCQYYAKRALQRSLKESRRDIAQEAYWYIGRSDFLKFDFASAVMYMQKAEDIYRKEPDTVALINILNTKGLSLRNLGNVEESILAFKAGLTLAKEIKNNELATIHLINLGASYKAVKSNIQAVKYYSEALGIAEKEKDSLHLGIILTNFGNIYSSLEEYDKTRSYYKRALAIHKENKNYRELGMIWANISHIDLKEKRFDDAIRNATNTINMVDSTFVPLGAVIVAQANLGEAFLRKKQYDSSRFYFNKAIQLSVDNKVPTWLEEIYLLKAELEEEQGYFSLAYNDLKKSLAIRDSLSRDKLIHKLNLEEKQTELNQKDKEISLLEEDNSIREEENRSLKKWAAIGIIALLFSTTIVYIYFLRQKSIGLALRKEAAENKLEALRNQMNPHFLFNSFNAVQNYILKSDKNTAYEYLTQIAYLIRKILDNSHSMKIDLKEELQIIKSYVKLEALRFRDKFKYDITIEERLLDINPVIPSMIIQPYIENAILHGLSNRSMPGGELKIEFRSLGEDKIQCIVEDNGIGREKALEISESKPESEKGNAIAMNNTSRRLQILEKAGYPKGKVVIQDLKENDVALGTRVIVDLSII